MTGCDAPVSPPVVATAWNTTPETEKLMSAFVGNEVLGAQKEGVTTATGMGALDELEQPEKVTTPTAINAMNVFTIDLK